MDSPFLKEYRLKHGITLEQLSDGLCSASGLARIEAGARTVGLEEEAALFSGGKDCGRDDRGNTEQGASPAAGKFVSRAG